MQQFGGITEGTIEIKCLQK